MKIHYLNTFTSSDRINVFHYCMFHGRATRPGISPWDIASHCLGDDLSQPLHLSRNGTRIPDVFLPETSLIISEKVKCVLNGLSNIVFLPVVFSKLIGWPYAAGDFSYFNRPQFLRNPRKEDPETLIDRLPDLPSLHKSATAYYELVIAKRWQIASKFPHVKPITVNTYDLGEVKPVSFLLHSDMMQEYPILRVEGGFLFSESSFDRVKEDIDQDYFFVSYTELPEQRKGDIVD